MASLADAVLPLIRTREDLYRYSAANAHGRQMHQAIDILEDAIPSTPAAEVHGVVHKALASALKVIARADDSSGIVGDACRRLLDLHPRTAHAAHTNPSPLTAWMIAFQFDGEVDSFELDPVAYAPALGPAGLVAYRARLEDHRSSSRSTWVLDWNDRRLAVLDRDVEAIIRTHARDRRVASWFEDTARALAEIGEVDRAVDWAREALDVGPQHQSVQAAEFWCTLLEQHRPDELRQARLTIFRRWPTSSSADGLYRVDHRPEIRDEILTTLESRPADAVIFALFTLKNIQLAWDLAQVHAVDDGRVWPELLKRYVKIDPLTTLPAHARLVEKDLVEADAARYRSAARRLADMRKLAANTNQATEVDELIAELRRTHYRRPRLQQEFDRAGLP